MVTAARRLSGKKRISWGPRVRAQFDIPGDTGTDDVDDDHAPTPSVVGSILAGEGPSPVR